MNTQNELIILKLKGVELTDGAINVLNRYTYLTTMLVKIADKHSIRSSFNGTIYITVTTERNVYSITPRYNRYLKYTHYYNYEIIPITERRFRKVFSV